jgi:hypothetical protein
LRELFLLRAEDQAPPERLRLGTRQARGVFLLADRWKRIADRKKISCHFVCFVVSSSRD